MKKSILKYTISLFLSLLIVFLQVGLVQTTHICGGEPVLSELSIGATDLHCGGNKGVAKAELVCENKLHSISKKPCCRNTSLSIQLDDTFQKKNFTEIVFTPLSVVFTFNLPEESIQDLPSFSNEKGYILTKDIPIWNQVFLI